MSISIYNETADVQIPNNNQLHRLAVEANKYLSLGEGNTLPTEEIIQQGKANGFTEGEVEALLAQEGYANTESIPVPPQGDVLGELWKVNSSALDNTVASTKNSPSSKVGDVEPLDEEADFLALQEPVALDSEACHPEYIKEGEPLTAERAVEKYVEERHGENTSANRHGFKKTRQWIDKRNYARGMEMDRQLFAEYDNPTTILFSLRVERTVPNRVSLLGELSAALESTLDALRYRIDKHTGHWEWFAVLAGTRQYATPHVHLYVEADGDVPREACKPVVNRFVESCKFAPSSMKGNPTEGGTIRIRGTEETDTIPRTDDGGSAGATYALTQLAHLPPVDEMAFDELLWASTVRAWEGGNHFRKSSYTVWDESKEPEPEETVEEFPEDTVLSPPTGSTETGKFNFTDTSKPDGGRFDLSADPPRDQDSDSYSD